MRVTLRRSFPRLRKILGRVARWGAGFGMGSFAVLSGIFPKASDAHGLWRVWLLLAFAATSVGTLAWFVSSLARFFSQWRPAELRVEEELRITNAGGNERTLARDEILQAVVMLADPSRNDASPEAGSPRVVVLTRTGGRWEFRLPQGFQAAHDLVREMRLDAGNRAATFEWLDRSKKTWRWVVGLVSGATLSVMAIASLKELSAQLPAVFAAMAGVPILSSVWAGAARKKGRVGLEGAVWYERGRVWQIPFSAIAAIERSEEGIYFHHRPGAARTLVGLSESEPSGGFHRPVGLPIDPSSAASEALATRIEEAFRAYQKLEENEPPAITSIEDASRDEILDSLREPVGFRDNALTPQHVEDALRDPRTAPRVRVAAAAALRDLDAERYAPIVEEVVLACGDEELAREMDG